MVTKMGSVNRSFRDNVLICAGVTSILLLSSSLALRWQSRSRMARDMKEAPGRDVGGRGYARTSRGAVQLPAVFMIPGAAGAKGFLVLSNDSSRTITFRADDVVCAAGAGGTIEVPITSFIPSRTLKLAPQEAGTMVPLADQTVASVYFRRSDGAGVLRSEGSLRHSE